MVLSSVNENWKRVELMHSLAYEYFKRTEKSDFRKRRIMNQNFFPHNVSMSQNIEKESSLVGMLMAWTVVALESLINHALAEKSDQRESAVRAINDPNKVIQELQLDCNQKSKLAKKIMILNVECNGEIVTLADELSEVRNIIVHDKPYDYFEYDGEIERKSYRSSSELHPVIPRYEDLKDFFTKCDTVKNYIEDSVYLDSIEIRNFKSLLTHKKRG